MTQTTLSSAAALAALALLAAVVAPAQEGFPLDGTWRGSYGPVGADAVPIVMVMKWDGATVNGTINPGPAAIPFENAVLDPAAWRVSIEARTAAGERISIEGTLEDIGAPDRRVEGTWTQAGSAYAFRIVRQ